jgi:hypothetical protein
MNRLYLKILPIFLFAYSCHSSPITAQEARQTADEHVRLEYGMTDLRYFDVQVRDRGNSWTVIYSPKPETTGGPLSVRIDKKSGRIQQVWGSQ